MISWHRCHDLILDFAQIQQTNICTTLKMYLCAPLFLLLSYLRMNFKFYDVNSPEPPAGDSAEF